MVSKCRQRTIRCFVNPELVVERARELYKAKGYPDDWIEERIKGIETRKTLREFYIDTAINFLPN